MITSLSRVMQEDYEFEATVGYKVRGPVNETRQHNHSEHSPAQQEGHQQTKTCRLT